MTDTAIHLDAPAGDIHRTRAYRHAMPLDLAPADCLYQFPTGYRCALEHGHEGPEEQHVAIRLDRERGIHVVCAVSPITHPRGHLAGARVALAMPATDTTPPVCGTVITLSLDDWSYHSHSAATPEVVVYWDGGVPCGDWTEVDDLVLLDEHDRPRGPAPMPATPAVPQRGLLCSILAPKDLPDCSGGGVSGRVTRVTLVGPQIDAVGGNVREPDEDAPAVALSRRTGIVSVVPVQRGTGAGPMFGGAFVWTSDSRFAEITRNAGRVGPLPLHDRWER